MIEKPVALITGATQGIGEAIALKFASEGYAVALTGRSDSNLKKVKDKILTGGGVAPLNIVADLRKSQDITRISKTVLKEWGKVDVLVNNAGVITLKPFLELSAEEFEEMMDVNIKAIFFLTQKIIPNMISRKTGTIVNIASLAGKNGFKSGTGYGATKFALRGFSASLMMEVREYNIRVVTLFPGSVNTTGLPKSSNSADSKTILQADDIAHAAFAAVSVNQRAMISEIDIRPSFPRKS